MLPLSPFQPAQASLETPRLHIRIDTEEAYERRFRTRTDAELKAQFGIASDTDLYQQRLKVAGGLSTYRTSIVFFHFRERATGRVIGNCAFHNWYPAHRRAELGYAITDVAFRQRGYMREALQAIVAYGFDAMALNRIEAFTSPENTPSRKLLEGLGFRLEGRLREHYAAAGGPAEDSMLYALLQTDLPTTGPA